MAMYSKQYILGPLDHVDQRINPLYRLLDKLDREVTMRVWQVNKLTLSFLVGGELELVEITSNFFKSVTQMSKHNYNKIY